MITLKTNIVKALLAFASEDKDRKNLRRIFARGGTLMATNGAFMVVLTTDSQKVEAPTSYSVDVIKMALALKPDSIEFQEHGTIAAGRKASFTDTDNDYAMPEYTKLFQDMTTEHNPLWDLPALEFWVKANEVYKATTPKYKSLYSWEDNDVIHPFNGRIFYNPSRLTAVQWRGEYSTTVAAMGYRNKGENTKAEWFNVE